MMNAQGNTSTVTSRGAMYTDVSPEQDPDSFGGDLDGVSVTVTKAQHPTSCVGCIIDDPTRRMMLLLCYALIPITTRIAKRLIDGPWVEHQCSSHISQLPPPMLFDISTGAYTNDPELSHDVTKSTISVELLLWTSRVPPIIALSILPTLAYYLCYRHRKTSTTCTAANTAATLLVETAAAISGFLTARNLTLLETNLGKVWFHRPRPNFYSLCHMDWETLQCTSSLCESRYSLPSGHSSLSACATVFVSCYIVGKIIRRTWNDCDNSTTITKKQIVASLATWILLSSWAVYVAATRVHEHWHRVSDVCAGLALGTVTSAAVYSAYFGRGPSQHLGCCFYGCLAESPSTTDDDDDDEDDCRSVLVHETPDSNV